MSNLPPGVSQRQIDRYYGFDDEPEPDESDDEMEEPPEDQPEPPEEDEEP